MVRDSCSQRASTSRGRDPQEHWCCPRSASARLKTYTIPAATKLRFWHVTPLWDAASFIE